MFPLFPVEFIDENLMRSELTPTEEAEHLQRRKEIWEAMQASLKPSQSETESKKTDTNPKGAGRDKEFETSTQESTGKSRASTYRATRRARELVAGM